MSCSTMDSRSTLFSSSVITNWKFNVFAADPAGTSSHRRTSTPRFRRICLKLRMLRIDQLIAFPYRSEAPIFRLPTPEQVITIVITS